MRNNSSRGGRRRGTWREGDEDFPFRHDPPPIPDHEVLRCIGKGSYGEVWMAEGLTGALRAVKVVHRADFELERTFEREFEGLRSFEPIARQSPGLVDILHVGRNTEHSFYFYVMELADDDTAGRDITPAEYVPKTLAGAQRRGEPLDLDRCIAYGITLTAALEHLHENGLAHRDIKPSNIIFVNGEPKLADIGLVTESGGERMYVGTDGFVPPEGPGSAQADIFSLGMVLYEITTGHDRLQFPELPAASGITRNRDKWLAVNEVICKACAPAPKKRYATARAMREDLEQIAAGAYRPAKFPKVLAVPAAAATVAALFAVWGGGEGLASHAAAPVAGAASGPVEVALPEPGAPVPLVAPVTVAIRSEPAGADVVRGDGDQVLGQTPFSGVYRPGSYEFTLKKQGHEDSQVSFVAAPGDRVALSVELPVLRRPVPGQPWVNEGGERFLATGDGTWTAELPVTYEQFNLQTGDDFLEGEIIPWVPENRDLLPEHVSQLYLVYVPVWDAQEYCVWLTERDKRAGFLPGDFRYRPKKFTDPRIEQRIVSPSWNFMTFRCEVFQQLFGTLAVTSDPPGAEVFRDGTPIGFTPFKLNRCETGLARIGVRLPGFQHEAVDVVIEEGENDELKFVLKESHAVVFGDEWQNSLGLVLLPVATGDEVMMARTETRRRDYARFVSDTGRPELPDPGFAQGDRHPVVMVSRDDAAAFCRWLTQVERESGRIGESDVYRLPHDDEWSAAVGIGRERGATPHDRGQMRYGVYTWGVEWPPPKGAGNFADARFQSAFRDEPVGSIPDYSDDRVETARVGSYDRFGGFHDLAGNVWEWVSDDFGGPDLEKGAHGVVRGGGWRDHEKETLSSSARLPLPPDTRRPDVGFRVVLARESPELEPPPTMPIPEEETGGGGGVAGGGAVSSE